MAKKISPYEDVVWKNVFRENKSGGGVYIREVERVGKGLVRPLGLEEVKPNTWYLLRPNGEGQNYLPIQISDRADYAGVKCFVKHGMLFVKTY